ncbi:MULTISPECIES: O-acetyl-ADP-ribose deacetylase [unclassified Arthrobacter]|jgi:O-acetyl-ADP-ribose deacetylase (regulator of RNase III)|uniref:O-acetyl-ADP-ribose deacetylase n=1 Tax=unclassified Arthrobacter TaxID=235627 RepID=UPI0003696217|nr:MULTISPECIES: O-acetyl-ADP-ribose deacetylase [unclassified Arthrobacter]BCW53245.1 O-acetyl-ADP-ribose deacetylase [Arthrobacter sp. StoSoilB19]BCW74330.1 O-acetyl-ADP-ribose deacetylase [Arthrobacter sp. NicSoilB11]
MRISVLQGDITQRRVDVVVNAADPSLLGGGGVDGALHRAAGPELLAACRELRVTALPHGLQTGAAVATPAFRLPARWVIHTVGPNRRAGQTNRALLVSCFSESLRLADRLEAGELAFPAVGAGAYGWPAAAVAQAALEAVDGFRASHPASGLELVEFVLHTADVEAVFRDVLGPLR